MSYWRVKDGAAEFASFVSEVQKLADLDKMRLAPTPKLKPAVAAPPNPAFRIKQGFAVSQYSGPLGYGGFPQASMIPAWHETPLRKEKEAGPPPEDDQTRLESSGDKPAASGRDGRLKTAAAALTPAGIFAKARTVGAPKLKAPGPSIAQQSKPVGFGTPLPGLTKRALVGQLVRYGTKDLGNTPRLLMRHRTDAERAGLQRSIEGGFDKMKAPFKRAVSKVTSRLPEGRARRVVEGGANLLINNPETIPMQAVPVPGLTPGWLGLKAGMTRAIDALDPIAARMAAAPA